MGTTMRVLDKDELKDEKEEYYHLVFDIKHCIFKAGNDTKLLFSIYDDSDKRIVSEEYCLHLSPNNFPKVALPKTARCYLRTSRPPLSNDICIICRIYRIGPMEAPDVMNHKKEEKKKKRKSIEIVRPYAATVIRPRDHIKDLLN